MFVEYFIEFVIKKIECSINIGNVSLGNFIPINLTYVSCERVWRNISHFSTFGFCLIKNWSQDAKLRKWSLPRNCERGPPVYRPYPRRLKSLQMKLQRQHFLLIYFKTLSVGLVGITNSRPPASQPGAQPSEPRCFLTCKLILLTRLTSSFFFLTLFKRADHEATD